MSERITDPNVAVDFIIKKAGEFAKAKAQRVFLDEFRKSKKALLMSECLEKAANAREQYAYAHKDYQALLEGLRAAVEVEEELKWQLEAARLRIETWRTEQANNRTQDKTLR